MTVYGGRDTVVRRKPLQLEKDLPSPPPKQIEIYHAAYSDLAARKPLNKRRHVKRSITAPQLPLLTKTSTVRRHHDYTPSQTISVARVHSQRVSLLASPTRPRTVSLPHPEQRIGLPKDVVPMSEHSNTTSDSTNSSCPISFADAQHPSNDLSGDLEASNISPSPAVLHSAADLPVLDAEGKEVPFKNLYWPRNETEQVDGRRVMILFIRHFFCGNCQEYVRHLSEEIPPESLPPRTSIVIIGCGAPSLIPFYTQDTSTPYPIYADPSKRLYSLLEMCRTLNLGPKNPDYIRHSLVGAAFQSVLMGLSRAGKGDMTKAGDMKQVGGEFLFEVKGSANASAMKKKGNGGLTSVEVTWCHRMRNTRDHAEIPVIREVLTTGRESDQVQHSEPTQTSKSERRPRLGNLRSFSSRRHSWIERRRSSTRERSRSGGRAPSTNTGEMVSKEDDHSHQTGSTVETVVEGQEPRARNA